MAKEAKKSDYTESELSPYFMLGETQEIIKRLIRVIENKQDCSVSFAIKNAKEYLTKSTTCYNALSNYDED